MIRRPLWLLVTAVLAPLALTTTATPATVPPCVGAQLTGTFRGVPGSAGAGNIVYALRLRNHSSRTCFVSGLPRLQLLGRTSRALPTQVRPAASPAPPAVRVVLRPGRVARADARFTPDVPGPGEPVDRQCEPKAFRIRVTPPPGGGMLIVPVSPPTPVCVHGRLNLKPFRAA